MSNLSRSEVCRLLGISRRTLQGYNEIGLVRPVIREESGYWEYDEEAFRRLIVIHAFVRAGYTRKEIIEVLALPDDERLREYDRAADRLREKRRTIDGTIGVLQSIRMAAEMPLMDLLSRGIDGDPAAGKDLSRLWDEAVDAAAGMTDEARASLPLWHALSLIACLRGSEPDADEVRRRTRSCYAVFWKTLMETDGIPEKLGIEELTAARRLTLFAQLSGRMLRDPKVIGLLDDGFGPGAAAFAGRAIALFAQRAGTETEEETE